MSSLDSFHNDMGGDRKVMDKLDEWDRLWRVRVDGSRCFGL